TILSVIFLNYLRSIIPLLTGTFISIVDHKDLLESETPKFLLIFYQDVSEIKYQLLITSLLIVCIAFIREITNIFVDVSIYHLSETIGCKAQIDYFKKVQDLPYVYLNHASSGDLIQRSTQDINRFKQFVTGSLLELFNSLCKVIIFGISMFIISPSFSLIVFIMFPIYFITSYIYFKKQSKDFSSMEEKEGKLTSVLQENLTGIRVVKAFANEEYEINKFNEQMSDYTSIWAKTIKRMSKFWGVSDFMTYFQLLVVFVLSIYYVINDLLSFDQVVTLFLFTEQIVWPCRNLGRQLAEFGKTSICANRILQVINQKDEYQEKNLRTDEIQGNIEFKDVCFQYEDATIPCLKNINLKIKKGESVAIIGKTGSGKSTFVNLLNRLIDPTSGQILLDGHDITTLDKKWVRKNVGVVLQEPYIYTGTISQNLNIMLPYDDKKNSKELAKMAMLDKDIESFSLKYDTVVGERGVSLSGGQRQRIAIARMLAQKKAILIFDDSLSALDSETDLKIRNTLKQKDKDTTMIVITHRIVTAKDADFIVVFEDGQISECGTHEQLILKEGLYKTIYEIQSMFSK
ncbi:MAG: ABC transporter ATP-binding protein/permease, partial [Erysipelotrichaceae bacterium]|nr:ABC transporter ATP-binding protein/permease [Erysipelotrichaceae bacterium]